MSIRRYCDICKEELTRNMVDDRLEVEQGCFSVEVMVSKKDGTGKDGTGNAGDLCYTCLMKMLNASPKKPRKTRSDKGSHVGHYKPAELPLIPPVSAPEVEFTLHTQNTQMPAEPPVKLYYQPNISTFAIRVPEPGGLYTLSLSGVSVTSKTLSGGIATLMADLGINQADVEASPDSEGKRILTSLLNNNDLI